MAAFSDYLWTAVAPITRFWGAGLTEEQQVAAFQDRLIALCAQRLPQLEVRPTLALRQLVEADADDVAIITRLFHEILRSYVPRPPLPRSSWRLVNWFYNWYYQDKAPVLKAVNDIFARNQSMLLDKLNDNCAEAIRSLTAERLAELRRFDEEDCKGSDHLLRELCLAVLQQQGGEKLKPVESDNPHRPLLAQKAASSSGKDSHRLDLSNSWQLNAKDLLFFLQRSPNLLSLDISYCSAVSNKELRKLLSILKSRCPDLQELSVSGTNIRDETFSYLLDSFPYLRSLAIADNPQLSDNASGELAQWAKENPELRSLDLAGSSFSGGMNAYIMTCCPHLEDLQLSHQRYCNGHDCELMIKGMAESSFNLRRLSIDWPELKDADLLALAKAQSDLEELTLVCNSAMTNEGLEEALGHWKGLKRLNLLQAPIKGKTLAHLLKEMEGLEELGLIACKEIKEDSLMTLGVTIKKHLVNLRKLTLGANDLSSSSYFDLFLYMDKESLARLRSLQIIDSVVGDYCLNYLAEDAVNLEELVLYNCPSITADAIETGLAKMMQRNKLKKVNLAGSRIDRKTLLIFGGVSRSLESLCLDRCEGLLPVNDTLVEMLSLVAVANRGLIEISVGNLFSYSEFHAAQERDFYLYDKLVDPLFCNSGINAIS